MVLTKHAFRLLLIATAMSLLAACSLTLDFEECQSDADCAKVAQPGETLVCDTATSYCLPGAANNAPNNGINNTPTNNGELCSNAGCIATMGENYICDRAANACVNLQSAECTSIEGPVNLDQIVVIGSILPTIGDNESKGLPREKAIRLAVKEINQNGGLPDGYRLVLVGCNDGGNSETAIQAANHLVNQLHVPAIIGPAFSGPYKDVVEQVTVPAGVLTISPSATSPTISDIADDDLAWRTAPSDIFQGVAMADHLRDLRAAAGGSLKVTVFAINSVYGTGLSGKLSTELADELGGPNFANFVFAEGGADIGTQVNAAFVQIPDPDVVVIIGNTDTVDVIAAVEATATTPPAYLLSDAGQVQELLTYVRGKDDLIARIQGTIPDLENGAIYEGFRFRYRQQWSEEPGAYVGNTYDAAYLVAYDLITLIANDSPISGASLARNIPNLTTGLLIEVGPTKFNQGKNTLQSGATINLDGVSGALQFNTATGDPAGNYNLWGIAVDAGGPEFENRAEYVIGDDGSGVWGNL